MKLRALKNECQKLQRKLCGGFCDQLGGYHQDYCHALSKVRHGKEIRVTYIRRLVAHVRAGLKASGVKV
jgi:hypothetical protein